MKLLEEKGYTDTDRWSEETFDQDYRPVIHEMIEKVYQYGVEEQLEQCKVLLAGLTQKYVHKEGDITDGINWLRSIIYKDNLPLSTTPTEVVEQKEENA